LSSILKALKKLENEYPSSGYDQPWLKEIDEKEAFFDRLKGNLTTYRQKYVICAAVLLAFIVSAAIIFKTGYIKKTAAPLLSEKQRVEAAIPAPSLQSRVQAPLASTPKGSVHPQLLDDSRIENQNLPTARSAKATGQVLSPREPAKVLSPVAKTSVVPLRQPVRPQAAIKASKAFSSFQPGKDTQTGKEVSALNISESSKPAGTVDTKILNDENVKLQAISWSENPEKRLAVINNSIVRQGDRVGSYVVKQINKDDILVRQEKEIWLLPFRPR
jgi:hypothetical protein